MVDHKFQPEELTINENDTVIWENKTDLVHSVTCMEDQALKPEDVHLPAGAQPFNSGDVGPGKKYIHVFHQPGVYKYFCIPHEALGMRGKITVVKR